jgi:hypothetical protein
VLLLHPAAARKTAPSKSAIRRKIIVVIFMELFLGLIEKILCTGKLAHDLVHRYA